MDAGGDASSKKSQATMQEREQFTRQLRDIKSNKELAPSSNGCTVTIVEKMSTQLQKDGVPMTPEHRQTAIESIKRGDCIVKFTVSENDHVLQSSGQGFAYKMGYGYHQFLKDARTPPTKEDVIKSAFQKDTF